MTKNKSKEVPSFEITPVCFTNLHKVVDIYKRIRIKNLNQDEKISSSDLLLTQDFGLPLGLVQKDKEVIGYSYVYLNDEHQAIIKSLVVKEYDNPVFETRLTDYAYKIFNTMYKKDDKDFSRLKAYIIRVVDWINT
ncbi:hypothetical protein HNP24_000960 [Chryseobacterium sediminis]|uniref:Uncharacterized protein n=1 Tax=Chryseobacterium sediminis TaxID=1679494 RepID=A0ABR6PWB9_9FLAO|nr:hypothetical protein [Chryseobacterium sediminis]MBB6330010.1 hypothetical protein [Chryseobacterium sediminis]